MKNWIGCIVQISVVLKSGGADRVDWSSAEIEQSKSSQCLTGEGGDEERWDRCVCADMKQTGGLSQPGETLGGRGGAAKKNRWAFMPLWCISLSRLSLTVIWNCAGQRCFCVMILSWVYTLSQRSDFLCRRSQTVGPKSVLDLSALWSDRLTERTLLPGCAPSSSYYRLFTMSLWRDSYKLYDRKHPFLWMLLENTVLWLFLFSF